jgi:myo-inositol-1(or 4)-monophosphatase
LKQEPTLAEVEKLARGSGKILRAGFSKRPGFDRKLNIKYKGAIDLVTEIDQQSEDYLIEQIRQNYPTHTLYTEESGDLPGDDCCCWYIDPLDGTVNYAHGVPFFAVSIAYQEAGLLRLGVVYDPIADECFTAERGKGAWLNGLPIRSSQTETLIESLLVTGFPYNLRTTQHNNLELYARLTIASQGVRRLGSAALDLCYVAAGRLEGYWEMSIMAYDVAAGGLIAEESGAQVTAVYGQADYLETPCSILAANPVLHPQLLRTVHETYPLNDGYGGGTANG